MLEFFVLSVTLLLMLSGFSFLLIPEAQLPDSTDYQNPNHKPGRILLRGNLSVPRREYCNMQSPESETANGSARKFESIGKFVTEILSTVVFFCCNMDNMGYI